MAYRHFTRTSTSMFVLYEQAEADLGILLILTA